MHTVHGPREAVVGSVCQIGGNRYRLKIAKAAQAKLKPTAMTYRVTCIVDGRKITRPFATFEDNVRKAFKAHYGVEALTVTKA